MEEQKRLDQQEEEQEEQKEQTSNQGGIYSCVRGSNINMECNTCIRNMDPNTCNRYRNICRNIYIYIYIYIYEKHTHTHIYKDIITSTRGVG